MSILNILQYPDSRLRKIAKPVISINSNVKKIINNMFETMYENNGIGLAATQVNIHLQIAVLIDSENKNTPIVLINPKILNGYGKTLIQERCLSIKNKTAKISRFSNIAVQSKTLSNKSYILKANSLLSVCIQHEIDHLIGKLFIDYSYKKG